MLLPRLKCPIISLLYLLSLCFLAEIIIAFFLINKQSHARRMRTRRFDIVQHASLPRWKDTLKEAICGCDSFNDCARCNS
jgi:hypothetical protein